MNQAEFKSLRYGDILTGPGGDEVKVIVNNGDHVCVKTCDRHENQDWIYDVSHKLWDKTRRKSKDDNEHEKLRTG